MKLTQLISNKDKIINLTSDPQITGITDKSDNVKKGSLYFCLVGKNYDGHNYCERAVKNGAAAIVVERPMPISLPQIVVGDSREAFSRISAGFYHNPQNKLKIIGVIGTNGKTSTAKLICDMLCFCGKKAAFIGTLGTIFAGKTIDTYLTTPDPDVLFATLSRLIDLGAEYVAMEVSAHAIKLKKTAAINFECLVFTNCTEDHLDYFKDYEEYKAVKKSAFTKNVKYFAVNVDDDLGREIYQENKNKTITYGIINPSDVFAMDIKESLLSTRFILNMFDMVYNVKTKLLGEFNVKNLLAASCALFLCGIKPDKIVNHIDKATPIKGRMQLAATYNGARVYIDYAHTPDGLDKSLGFLSAVSKGKTIVVFGAGGNRDKQKRPLMGKVAIDLADVVILTSDNPRYEDPLKIIEEIAGDIKSPNLLKITDRSEAIIKGLSMLSKGDTLLIAGKGSETTTEVLGKFYSFSDIKAVKSGIKLLKTTNAKF